MASAQPINLQYTTIKNPLPPFIYEKLKNFSAGANLYRPQPEELISKLAIKYNLPKEMIFLTAGNDEAIQIFALAYGENAYVFTPTYVVYADVEELGGKLTHIPAIRGTEYIVPTQTIKAASLIYLANPNNPSGVTPKEKVMDLVKNNTQAIVAVDEAYAGFANLSVIDRVKEHQNMAVFRSFSKDYGMAGNRIAFIVAHPHVIAKVKNKTQWANTSYLSVGAAVAALDNEDYFANMREDINHRRDTFIEFLKQQGFKVFPSKINAVLLKFESEEIGRQFAEFLNSQNIIVSLGNGASNIGLDESFVRIAIGNAEQMQTVQEAIETYRKEKTR